MGRGLASRSMARDKERPAAEVVPVGLLGGCSCSLRRRDPHFLPWSYTLAPRPNGESPSMIAFS